MALFRNAANSFSDGGFELALYGRGSGRADPGIGPGRRVAITHQLHEFLRRRFMAAVAALLRHGAGNPVQYFFRGLFVARARSGLTRRAGRGFASIDVVTAHDQNPLLKLNDNAQLPGKVAASGSTVSPAPMLRFTRVPKVLHQRKVKKSRGASNPALATAVSISVGRRRYSCEPSVM